MVIVPSSAVDTMNLGGLMGTTAMAGMAQEMVNSGEEIESQRDETGHVAG